MTATKQSDWKQSLQNWITQTTSAADDFADSGIRKLRKRFGRQGVPQIQSYMGYASANTIHLHGRVLTNPPLDPDFQNDSWWENLTNTIQRFASDEVPDVEVEASFDGRKATAVSDAEGYFHITLPRTANPDDAFWDLASFRILNHPPGTTSI